MIKELKHILNTYTDKELEDIDLWINSNIMIDGILIEEGSIDLITENSEIRIDGLIDKEKNEINNR